MSATRPRAGDMSTANLPRRELALYGETYGTRWSDSPDLAGVFYAEPPTELDPLGVAGDDDEPVILPCADDWLESYASRDYLPEAEQ